MGPESTQPEPLHDELWHEVELLTMHDETRRLVRSATRAVVRNLFKEHIPPFKPILEVGAGLGYLSDFVPFGHLLRYRATEQSPEYLELLRKKTGALASKADIYDLPFRDESFDAVVSISTMTAVDDLDRATAETRRVLKPGGTMISIHDLLPVNSVQVEDLIDQNYMPFPLGDERSNAGYKLVGFDDLEQLLKGTSWEVHRGLLEYFEDPDYYMHVMHRDEPDFFKQILDHVDHSPVSKTETADRMQMFEDKFLALLAKHELNGKAHTISEGRIVRRQSRHTFDDPEGRVVNYFHINPLDMIHGYDSFLFKRFGNGAVHERVTYRVITATKE